MEYEESIYNLIPKERYQPPKQDRHKSKHPATVPPTASTFCLKTTSKPGVGNLNGEYQPEGSNHMSKAAGGTMGKALGASKPTTTDFRKKGTGTIVLPNSKWLFRSLAIFERRIVVNPFHFSPEVQLHNGQKARRPQER